MNELERFLREDFEQQMPEFLEGKADALRQTCVETAHRLGKDPAKALASAEANLLPDMLKAAERDWRDCFENLLLEMLKELNGIELEIVEAEWGRCHQKIRKTFN